MDAKNEAAANDMNNFDPIADLIQEEESDTLLLYLHGFTKEQLRVQLAKSGTLKISGTRPLGDDKWSSFMKDFRVSENCDMSKVNANFEDGILYVRQPKLIVPAKSEATKLPSSEIPQNPKNAKQEPKQDMTNHNNQVKQNKIPEKSVHDEEPKSMKEKEKIVESESAKNFDKKSVQEKTVNDEQKIVSRSSGEKRENVSANTDAALVHKGIQNAIASVNHDMINEKIPAERLKKARQIMNMVIAIVVVFAFGMYVSKLTWRSDVPKN